MSAATIIKKRFTGVSWRNPVVGAALRALDPIDAAVRYVHGRRELPRYSARVRSNGIGGQFGGAAFRSLGLTLVRIIREHTSLSTQDRVLEIGCGCGRLALALRDSVGDGMYTGVDIDAASLEACRRNAALVEKQFQFVLLDVNNPIWNPDSTQSASTVVFPFADGAFELIVLISVFTHLLPQDLSHYAAEIGRMLRPGGKVLFSCFLMDHGTSSVGLSFPYARPDHWLHQEALPEKAVGYDSGFLTRQFAAHGMLPAGAPLFGRWRRNPEVRAASDFAQDILIYSRAAAP